MCHNEALKIKPWKKIIKWLFVNQESRSSVSWLCCSLISLYLSAIVRKKKKKAARTSKRLCMCSESGLQSWCLTAQKLKGNKYRYFSIFCPGQGKENKDENRKYSFLKIKHWYMVAISIAAISDWYSLIVKGHWIKL